jgi:midasin (ATPase involved in ribosome maturation)
MLLLSLVLILGCPQEINVRVDEDEDTGEFVDRDGDGFGIAEDCDDTDAAVNPDAEELCATAGIDDNCDGTADEDTAIDALTWFADTDSDGFGDPATATASCTQPGGLVADSTDCDDTDAAIHPGGTDGLLADRDCDGSNNVNSLSLADYSFVGENSDDRAGRSVSSAGDVDGDGLDDLLVGAFTNGDGGSDAGKAYLILSGL